jgi:hypothetical protein
MRCTSPLCMSLLCSSMLCIAPPPFSIAGLVLASALPHRRSLRGCPCHGTAVRGLVALRAGRSRAATPHLHPRMPEPRASLARIALLLSRLNPSYAPLLVPGRSLPLGSHSCARTLTLPSRVAAPPRTRCSTCVHALARSSPAHVPIQLLHHLLWRSLEPSLPRAQLPRALARAHSALRACVLVPAHLRSPRVLRPGPASLPPPALHQRRLRQHRAPTEPPAVHACSGAAPPRFSLPRSPARLAWPPLARALRRSPRAWAALTPAPPARPPALATAPAWIRCRQPPPAPAAACPRVRLPARSPGPHALASPLSAPAPAAARPAPGAAARPGPPLPASERRPAPAPGPARPAFHSGRGRLPRATRVRCSPLGSPALAPCLEPLLPTRTAWRRKGRERKRSRERKGKRPVIKERRRIRESREGRQVGFSKGVYAILENHKDLSVKQNFPLI